jgi:intein-encoded DNA endonuclease-like protein
VLPSEYDLESECSIGKLMWVRGASEKLKVEGQSAETKKQGTRGRRMQVAMSRTRAARRANRELRTLVAQG